MKVFNYAMVCWPAKEISPQLFICDPDVKALDWHFCADVKEWSVIPTLSTCPMYAMNKVRFIVDVRHYILCSSSIGIMFNNLFVCDVTQR